MIDKNDLPGSKHERTIALKAAKAALLSLAEKCINNELTTGAEITGELWNYVEILDKELDA
jgi:hypothetical protein